MILSPRGSGRGGRRSALGAAAAALAVPRPALPLRDVVRQAPGARRRPHRRDGVGAALPAQRRQRRLDRGRGHRRLPGGVRRRRPAGDRQLHRHLDPRPRGQPADGPARHPVRARLRLRLRRPGLLLRRREQDRHQRRRRTRPRQRQPRVRARPRVRPPRRPAPRHAGALPGGDRLGDGALGERRERLPGQPRAATSSRATRGATTTRTRARHSPRPSPSTASRERRWSGPGSPALRPSAASLRALRAGHPAALAGPDRSFTVSGRVPRSGAVVREFRTPFDGRSASARPASPARLRADHPQPLRQAPALLAPGRLPGHRLDYTVCGQSRLRVAVQAHRRRASASG